MPFPMSMKQWSACVKKWMGENKDASWEIVRELREKGYRTKLESCLPLGDVKVEIVPKKTFRDYMRALQMDTGEASCQWTDDGVGYRCDGFVSRTDDVAVYRIRAEKPVILMLISTPIFTEKSRNPSSKRIAHV